jgi:hypothetical protein
MGSGIEDTQGNIIGGDNIWMDNGSVQKAKEAILSH